MSVIFMKKLLILPIVLAAGLLGGCAQRSNLPSMSPAQSELENKKALAYAAQVEVKACQEGLRNLDTNRKVASAVNIVDSEVLFFADNSPNKITLMASSAKISEPQKKALLEYISANQECRNIIKQRLRTFPTLSPSYDTYYSELDIVYAQLISKQITIGQANQEKAKLLSKAKADYANGTAAIDNQFKQQYNQENQARQSTGGGGGVLLVAPTYNAPSMAPFMTNPNTLAPVRGNTQPFQQPAPQLPIQNPSVNCTPTGGGGFRCQ